MTTALKFGKYAGTQLPSVPGAYLAFLMSKPDLWSETRGQIEAELKRRAGANTKNSGSGASSSPARAGDEETEPLDARLRGDEERVLPIRCPRCGHDVDCFVRLVRK